MNIELWIQRFCWLIILFLYSSLSFFFYFLFSFLFFYFYFFGSVFIDFYLFSFYGLDLSFCFLFDYVSLGFFSCVSFISGTVFLYRIFYIEGTEDIRRFGSLVFLFVLSIFFLVFSGNFFITIIGWDGLGLVSFCLVIFYSNSYRLESGLVTVFSNRVGDVFFIISFLFFYLSGNFFFDSFFFNSRFFFGLMVFFGAITKRAQAPFRAWLPAAMAAPTPVSSLVHSSTLVTAGVYVLIRFNFMFVCFSSYLISLLFVFTIVIAGAVASLEKDFKKIVAMSTLSQLGIIIFILSVGGWFLSFIHMVIHAFFKRMLFLRTGSLMGQSMGFQDSRFYGSYRFSYFSFLFFLVRRICLSGFPFFVGFYSKDFIISFFSLLGGLMVFYFFVLGCIFTVLYRFRLIYEGYLFMIKYTNFVSYRENTKFFLPVLALFLKCWLLGGIFYWLFLCKFSFYFFVFDLFMGIFLMIFGFVTYKTIKYFYFLYLFLSFISFFRWKTSSPSFTFRKILFNYFDSTWIEIFGGGGAFLFLNKINSSLHFFFVSSLGWLVVTVSVLVPLFYL